MQEGRLPYNTYQRCIGKDLKTKRGEILRRGSIGSEGTVIQVTDDRAFVMSANTALSCEKESLQVAFFRAVNELAVLGASPVSLTVQMLLPVSFTEPQVRSILIFLDMLCMKEGIQCVNGPVHTVKTVTEPIVTLTANGILKKDGQETENTGWGFEKKAVPGDTLVMTKFTGLSGTGLLSAKERGKLQKRFQGELLDHGYQFLDYLSAVPEAAVAGQHGVRAMHAVSEGGILAALWDFAEREKLGLTVDLKAVPIRQETVEFCEYLGVNPYQLAGDGALLIAASNPALLLEALQKEQISAGVIGQFTDSHDRILLKEEDTGFLERPKADEIYRFYSNDSDMQL